MLFYRLTCLFLLAFLLVACSEEQPPRSVSEFVEDKLLLEAALVRCTANRAESRYDAECVNAREAVKLIEAEEEKTRRAELEKLSERKRESLRRTQQAAAEARRRAAEMDRLRKEAEYQAQFGLPMPPETGAGDAMAGNEPQAVIPAPQAATEVPPAQESRPAPDVSNQSNTPVAEVVSQEPAAEEPVAADLGAIREELRRRSEQGGTEETP